MINLANSYLVASLKMLIIYFFQCILKQMLILIILIIKTYWNKTQIQ